MLVFSLKSHPVYTCFTQCITFDNFPSYVHELSYSLFVMTTMFWFPLSVIFYTYTSIFVEICRRSKEGTIGATLRQKSGRDFCSGIYFINSRVFSQSTRENTPRFARLNRDQAKTRSLELNSIVLQNSLRESFYF